MPFVAAAGAIATAVVSTTSIGVWTAAQYAVAAISMHYANRSAKRRAGEANRLARQGRGFDIRNTVTSRSLIVGRAAVGVERIVFRKAHGDNRELMTFIACFGAHEIDEVEDILFNGESVGLMSTRDSDGWYADSASKYVRTKRNNVGTGGDQWPSTGGLIVLPAGTESIISVAVVSGDNVIDLTRNTHYSISEEAASGGTVTRLTVLAASAQYTGLPYRITCRVAEYRSLVRAKVYKGVAAGEADAYAMAIPVQNASPLPGDPPEQIWTASHLLKGQPHVSFTLRWDSDVFGPVGFPEITFVVRGAKCRDFVAGTTTWTDNAARIAAWYLMRPEGFGASLANIDPTLAIAAQNACDETVPYGEDGSKTQPRYRCDGVIDVEANPIENLNDILGAMAGDAVPVGSAWDIYAGVAQTPLYTLTDKDLAGGEEEFRPDSGLGELVNCVRGVFVDATNAYKARDIVPYESAAYIAQDGGEKSWLDVPLPMTTDPWAAQRIARLRLHQARNAATWTTTYNLGAYPVRAGQTIRCQHSEYGWDTMESGAGKRFSVMSRRMSAGGDIVLAAMETSAAIYSWNYDEGKEPDPSPNTDFPDPTYVEPLSLRNPVSNATTYDVGTNNEKLPYVLLSWEALPPEVVLEAKRIEIEWKGSGELSFRTDRLTPDQTSLKLRPVWGGMLIAGSARVINALGVASEPAFFDHRASMDLPGNQQAVSANLLANPTFKSGVLGWQIALEAGATDNIYFRKPLSQIIPGVPTQVRIEQVGSQNKHAVLYSDPISVIPGRRYCGYVECNGTAARTRVQMLFYNAAGVPVGSAVGGMVEGGVGGPESPANYRMSEVFMDAPALAAMARLWFVKFGSFNGAPTSWGDFYRPFFGEVPSGSTQRPPWDPGGLPSIYTDSIEVGAVTEIMAPAVADLDVERFTPPYVSRQVLSFTPGVDGDIEITIQASTRSKAEAGHTYTLLARVAGDNLVVKPGQTVAGSSWKEVHVVPAGAAVAGTFTISATFGVTAGVPCSLRLYMARGPVATSVSTGGTITVSPTGSSIPEGADKAFAITPRVTFVKR